MKKYALLFAVLAFIAGCSAKSEFLKDDFKYETGYLGNVTLRSFKVVDERTDVTYRELNPKFFAKTGDYDRISPALTADQFDLIKGEILKHLGKEGESYDFTASIQRGEKIIRTVWPHKYEVVNVTVKLQMSNEDGVKACTGDSSLEVKSLKASDEYIESMYRKTIRECVHECFLAFKEKMFQ